MIRTPSSTSTMPDRDHRPSRKPEIGTPWIGTESLLARPAPHARPTYAQSRGAREPASTGRLGYALSHLPEVWLWVVAGLSLLLATVIASLAHSLLLLPLLPMVVLLAITGVVRMLVSDGTESEIPGVVVGVFALVFGWLLGAWMLWMIPASIKLSSTKPGVGVALVFAAALGALTLPALAIALGLRARVPGSDAWLAVRLGAIAGGVSVVGSMIFAVLMPSG
jgi:hypothetical protein